MSPDPVDPLTLLRPRRTITGMSAVLLPHTSEGHVDWPGFEALLARTLEAGLTPAINMDTGYVNLLDLATQDEVLDRARSVVAGGPLVAGAFVADVPGSPLADDQYRERIDAITRRHATPVLFPSYGLTSLPPDDLVAAHERLAVEAGQMIAFELSPVFAPFGAIFDLATYEALLAIPAIVGAKHSSLDRQAEWDRLALRDRVRPDFKVLTGNDLAIDMVMYGSDYLLGLSAFAPDAFARRDAYWRDGDPRFHQLNDVLQYLGAFSFRAPVPAYKHDAAMFLARRGWIGSDASHPASPARPPSDRDVLAALLDRLDVEMAR